MKKIIFVLALAACGWTVTAQTQEPKKEVKKEACCKKDGEKKECEKDSKKACCKKKTEAKKKA